MLIEPADTDIPKPEVSLVVLKNQRALRGGGLRFVLDDFHAVQPMLAMPPADDDRVLIELTNGLWQRAMWGELMARKASPWRVLSHGN